MAIAKKATRYDTFLKIMSWGEPGAGKTRLALSFPSPLIIDLERGSRFYADQFDFLVAEPTPALPGVMLIKQVVDEIVKGEYPGQQTLIIDPITDYLDQLEWEFAKLKESKGISLDSMKAPQKAGYYAEQKDFMRQRLDAILRLPMNIVFNARAKNNWEGSQVNGKKADASEIVEYLCDIVLHIEKGGTAQAKKSRIKELPGTIRAVTYADIEAALSASPVKAPAASKPQAMAAATIDREVAIVDIGAEMKRTGIGRDELIAWTRLKDYPPATASMTNDQIENTLAYLKSHPDAVTA